MSAHAWCGTCRRMTEVMDEYVTGPLGAEYVAKPLSCGHDGNDGGHAPSKRPVRSSPATVARLVELQQRAAQQRVS